MLPLRRIMMRGLSLPPRGGFSQLAPNEAIQQKIQQLEQNQPFFDRFIFFDPDVMATLPGPLQVFDPFVDFGSGFLQQLHDLGLPWVGVLAATCLLSRSTLLPLIYLQMKRTTRLATVIPAISQMKRLIDKAEWSRLRRLYMTGKVSYDIVRQQRLKWMRLFLYNVFHFPMMITLIWSIRRLLVDESFKQTSLLWIPSLSGIDPYYVLPFATVGCFYYNLQRFITPENKDTIPSRLRGVGQILLIMWLPFLSNWPAAIQLYMFFNALFSVFQTSVMLMPEFQKFVDPKIFLYQIIIRLIEYDKNTSQALIEQIKTGEETHSEKAIQEEELVRQMKKVLLDLEEQQNQEVKERQEKEKPNFM